MEIRGNVFVILIIFVAGVLLGAGIYHNVEGWTFLDSLYFVVITVTTIGYGDLAPVTMTGKIFTMFFAFFGVTTALYLFSKINSAVFKKHVTHVDQKVSEMKKDIKKEEQVKEEVKKTIRNALRKKKGK